MANIVVVGAGVSGLTTALLLSKNPAYSVTIVAKHMPGDYDIEYTSPWAGANFSPHSNVEKGPWERNTFPELYRLAKEVPESGIHLQDSLVLNRSKDAEAGAAMSMPSDPNPWYTDVVPDYRVVPTSELPPGYDFGLRHSSVCINTALYLPYLASQCLAHGARISRTELSHIADAASLHHSGKPADVVVNCTGLLASKLGGVMDAKVTPARGQTVVVRNEATPMIATSGTDDGPNELCYIMQRAAGGGTVLGGTYQEGSWEAAPDMDIAARIMKRAVEVCPELAGGKGVEGLSVIRHGVGLRP
ncbi:D-amino acid oxidase [Pseudogymnoascus australis]